jgi:predicted DNA binding CopG/RHH family protein
MIFSIIIPSRKATRDYLNQARIIMSKAKTSLGNRVLKDYESEALRSSKPGKAGLRRFQQAARATMAKDRRLNIRLSSPVLEGLQARASEEGLPYQTLIASVLHKFVTGRLVEKPAKPVRR